MEEVVLGISMEDDGTSPKKKDRDCDAAGSCGGLDLGFGFGFSYGTTSSHDVDQVISCHREKMIRTEPPFPFRMTNASTTTMASPIFTGAATSASTPLPPLHPSVALTSPYRNGALYGNPNVFRGADRTGAVSGAVHLQQDVAARALQMQLQGSLASSPFKSASYSPAPVSVGTSFATAVPPGPATALFTHPLFTPGQWQELQRQALIYKHFVSCAPVPQDLLLDTRSIMHPNAAAAPGGGFLNLRLSGGAVDPEPGRCRRTDGKKWRCSRDAAPDQRYCERHLHRGRPRSRKPVERGRNKTAAPAPAAAAVVDGKTNIGSPSVAAAASDLSGGADNGFSGFPFKSSSSGLHHQVSSPYCLTAVPKPELMKLPFLSMLPEKEPRYLDWIKDGGISEIQHHAAPNNTSPSVDIAGFRSTPVVPILQGFPDYRHLNPGTMPDINTSTYPFVNLDQHPPPRRFIDAWSAEGHASGSRDMANCSNPFGATTNASSDQLSPSSLTLSMSGGGSGRSGSGDYVPDHIQMGLAVNELSSNTKSQPMFGPFGGPLAEVLQSGSSMAYPRTYGGSADGGNNASGGFVGAPSASYTGLMNLMSRSCSESEGVSPRGDSPPRVLSSPTGVLQRALVSLSDSSSNSSPRFGTGCGGARPEVGLQWMNHNKKWW